MVVSAVRVLQGPGRHELANGFVSQVQNLHVCWPVVDPGCVPDLVALGDPDTSLASEIFLPLVNQLYGGLGLGSARKSSSYDMKGLSRAESKR